MSLDRDLRDALQGLAGDPVADAARVLAALPPLGPPSDGSPSDGQPKPPRGKPTPNGVPPIAWWLLGAGLVVGGIAGAFVGRSLGAPMAPAKQEQPDQPKTEPKDKEKEQPQPKAPSMLDSSTFQIAAFGDIAIDEPGQGFQDVRAGSWWVKLGTSVMTRESQAGVLVVANDARARLDQHTQARFTETEYTLDNGRLWVDSLGRKTTLRIEAGIAFVLLEGGTVMVQRDPAGIAVTAIAGNVTVRNKRGETARLDPQQEVWIDPDRGMTQIRQVPFLPTATSWMTEMITLETDDSELRQRIKDVVAGYEEGTRRELAEREIRKLGSRCVGLLVYSALQAAAKEPDYAHAAAALAAQLAEFRSLPYMLQLLEGDDGELRVSGARAITRTSGIDSGKDEAFWRSGEAGARGTAVSEWKALLLK